MLDSPHDGDPEVFGSSAGGLDLYVVEEPLHQHDEPAREVEVSERSDYEVVVHGVEGFGRVHEEYVEVTAFLHRVTVVEVLLKLSLRM